MAIGGFLLTTHGFKKETLKEVLQAVKDAGLNTFFDLPSLVLDDMLIKTPYGEYDLSPNKNAVDENGKPNFSTVTDMDEILDFAKELGIEYIPCFASVSHFYYCLRRFPQFRYEGTNSVNIKDPEAVAFCYAVIEKYADYFKAHGCKYFNIGADEFAQELNGEMGFETIYLNGEMKYFVDFMNGLISLLADKGLEVMAYNDGICYAEDSETYGKIDTRLIVLYWSPGWGRKFASPLYLERQGYRVLNSYHSFYIDANTRDFESRLKNHQEMKINEISEDWRFKINNGVGAQFCCWSIHDTAPADFIKVLAPHIKAFGEAFSKQK